MHLKKNPVGQLSNNISSAISNHQKQQINLKNKSLSASDFTFKNMTLSNDFAVKINQGNPPKTDNFNITKGYKIEPVLWNLNLPSTVTFDDKGNMYIAESGKLLVD